jgi:hypothetical protein
MLLPPPHATANTAARNVPALPIRFAISSIPRPGPQNRIPLRGAWLLVSSRAKGRIIPSQPPSDDGSPSSGLTFGLVGLLIELVLPVALSAAVLLVLASYTSHWDLHTAVGLGAFGLLLVVLSLFLSVWIDAFTLARRRRSGKRRLLNRTDWLSRRVKFVLGGLVIPVAALIAANRLELPNHETPMTAMSLAVRSRLAGPEVNRAAQLGDAVLRAQSPAAKVQGLLALQSLGSVEALDQLLRILSDDPTVLKNGNEYQALSAALASHGVQAKARLLQRFIAVSPSARASAPPPPGDPFEHEIDGRSAAEGESQAVPGPGSLPSFIMQTFLRMGLKEDADLLAFARQTAADDGWSEAVRGQALLLTAQLGGKDDLDGLYAYLESPSALLQAHAMRAIAALQSKVSAAATKG